MRLPCPGRLLAVGEGIPLNVLRFIAAQLGMRAEDLDGYAVREETRREHLAELRRIYAWLTCTQPPKIPVRLVSHRDTITPARA